MATSKALQLHEHLKDGQLKPVYALVGDDDALVTECIGALRSAVEGPELPGSTTRDLAEEPDPRDVLDELRTQPFMGMKGVRLVIVRKGAEFLASHGDLLVGYLEAPARHGVLVLCCERLDGRAAAAKAISRVGIVVDCSRLRWQDARNWLDSEARKLGKTLTPRAASALVEAVGPNLTALRNELQKLVVYRGNESVISESDVEELVPESRARSIFELAGALAGSDAQEAIRIGESLLLKGEHLEGIVAFLGRQVRILWQVKRMMRSGAAVHEVARELQIPEFAAEDAAEAVKKLEDEWFSHQFRILAAADTELKTSSVQSREQRTWLTGLLTELCRSALPDRQVPRRAQS